MKKKRIKKANELLEQMIERWLDDPVERRTLLEYLDITFGEYDLWRRDSSRVPARWLERV